MAFDFNTLIGNLEGMGLYDVVLPFLLIFSITYGILTKVKIFGSVGDRINPIISLIIAFFFIRSESFVEVVNTFFPKVSLYIIVIFGLMMIFALFGRGTNWGENAFSILVIVSIIFIIWAAYESLTTAGVPGWSTVQLPDLVSTIVVVAIILILFSIMGGGKSFELKHVGQQFPKSGQE